MKQLFIILAIFMASCSTPNNDKSIGDGFIDTGGEVPKVNLWSSLNGTRTINASLDRSTPVDIIGINGEYYYVRNQLNKREYGYCNKGFVSGVIWKK